MKKKIAFDYQIFWAQRYGGISRYIVNLALDLNSQIYDVNIISPLYRNKYLKEIQKDFAKGFYIGRYPRQLSIFSDAINIKFSEIFLNNWKPDLLHETYYANKSVAPKKCPIIITVHDLIHEKFSDRFSKNDKTSKLKKIAIERADQVICVSENTKRDLIDIYGIDSNKLNVVHNGVSEKKYNYLNSINIENNIDYEYLLYVGTRDRYKNFLAFIAAVGRNKNLKNRFKIIAFGGNPFNEEEKGYFKKFKFEENKIIYKSGCDVQLQKLYQGATAMVYPSLYEGFGMPPLEAMMNSCPVISSNTSSLSEVIGNAAEYFDPLSIEEMSEAIERVVYNPNRAKELINLGEKRVKNFSWESVH